MGDVWLYQPTYAVIPLSRANQCGMNPLHSRVIDGKDSDWIPAIAHHQVSKVCVCVLRGSEDRRQKDNDYSTNTNIGWRGPQLLWLYYKAQKTKEPSSSTVNVTSGRRYTTMGSYDIPQTSLNQLVITEFKNRVKAVILKHTQNVLDAVQNWGIKKRHSSQ